MVKALEIVEVYVDHVGQQIKEIRERKGLQRTTVARFANIHRNTLYLIEAGERTPSLGVLQRIADALEVPPRELFPKALAR